MESLYLLIPLSIVLVFLIGSAILVGAAQRTVRRHGRSGLPNSHG